MRSGPLTTVPRPLGTIRAVREPGLDVDQLEKSSVLIGSRVVNAMRIATRLWLGEPHLNAPRCRRPRRLSGCWSIDLCDERRLAVVEDRFDSTQRPHEVVGKVRACRLSDDDDERNLEAHHRRQLIRNVANPAVVRDRDPAIRSTVFQPLLVAAIRRKRIGVGTSRMRFQFADVRESSTAYLARGSPLF